jgi:two-component system sensor histidine kinase BarA
MLGRLSLATKCLLLFGAAAVLIISSALAVPWFKMNSMVDETELEVSRQVLTTWEQAVARAGPQWTGGAAGVGAVGGVGVGVDPAVPAPVEGSPSEGAGVTPAVTPPTPGNARLAMLDKGRRLFAGEATLMVVGRAEYGVASQRSSLIQRAWGLLERDPKVGDYSEAAWRFTVREYRVVRAIRDPDGKLDGVVVIERSSPAAASEMLLNTLYLFAAGCVALGFAVLVFYLVTNKIILSPVRRLRETAEEVREGNLDTRSDIQTRDEFEDLAEAFNEMLTALQAQQKQLRAINASLDEKLNELTERNVALYEAAKLKGEFLANVTHELRTPLNSILGFAELLDEGFGREVETDESGRLAKRRRYVENILTAGRALLDLITGLLEMAKVEAGKMEMQLRPVDIRERCEQLAALMKPVADKRGVELRVELAEDMPRVETDARKLQQVIFNLLSNAIKFTADAHEAEREAAQLREYAGEARGVVRTPLVTLRAERLVTRTGASAGALAGGSPAAAEVGERVRISVLDTGPGIKREDLGRIFEKFTQLDTGYARKHAGTGLGLAICKELTSMLQGELIVQSDPGMGSMFSVILPLTMDVARVAEMKAEGEFRGALAGQKTQ